MDPLTLLHRGRPHQPHIRTASCYTDPVVPYEPALLVTSSAGVPAFRGLRRCRDVWACPLCAAIDSGRKRAAVADVLAYALDHRLPTFLVTLTARHGPTDSLTSLFDRFAKARRTLFSRPSWRRIAREHSFSGTVRTWECTDGPQGWHLHTHELLLFADPDRRPDLKAWYPAAWASAAATARLHASHSIGADVQGVTAGGRASCWSLAEYACAWGPGDELAPSHEAKRPRDNNRTPWDLLAAAARGETLAADRWTEYATATHGRRHLSWSRTLADLRALALVDDDPEPDGPTLLELGCPDCHAIAAAGAHRNLLDAGLHGRDAARDALADILHGPDLEADDHQEDHQ